VALLGDIVNLLAGHLAVLAAPNTAATCVGREVVAEADEEIHPDLDLAVTGDHDFGIGIGQDQSRRREKWICTSLWKNAAALTGVDCAP